VERGYERQGVAARLARAAGLVGRLLGSAASAQLGAADAARPAGLSGARVNPGRRGLLAMAVVTVGTVLVAGGWVLAARPHPMLASATPGTSPSDAGTSASLAPGGSLTSPRPSSTAPGAGSAAAGSALLVVDVAGKVRRPGVYRLPPGARVEDAVRAAGGFGNGVDPVTVNLARKLVDGEQVLIGVLGGAAAAGAGPPDPGAAGAATAGPLDLNSATLAQLDALPGVGPVLAQHILDWRTGHRRFDSVDQLNGVTGIGDSKFADLKPLVTVG
jgi:competence protein ComEA